MAESSATKTQAHPKTVLYSFLPLIFGVFSLFIAFGGTKPALPLPTATRTKTPSPIPTHTIQPTSTRTSTATPRPTATLAPERSQLRYSVEVTNIYVLLASHILANQSKAADEYRVLLIGDSGTWSNYMPFAETLAGRLNAANLPACNARTIKVYNMAIRGTSLVKDLVFIDKAATYQPDLVIWFLTLNTFRPDTQLLGRSFLPESRSYIEDLSKRYSLGLNTSGMTTTKQTADQAWEILRTAQEPLHQDAYPLMDNDSSSSNVFTRALPPPKLDAAKLPFNVFYTGLKILSKTKTLVVNEPIYIAKGANSDIRYNEYYPRWAYDQYRAMMVKESKDNNWEYLDLWNAIPSELFTGTPLHRMPYGEFLMYRKLSPILQKYSACP